VTQIGEAIKVPDFVSPELHSEQTCPWHLSVDPDTGEMEPQEPDEDAETVPKNLGTKLGKNLNQNGYAEPRKPDGKFITVPVAYKPGDQVAFTEKVDGKMKTKVVRQYDKAEEYEYPVQYAPHHLIPGNESLKKSPVVRFMGHKDAIKHYGDISKIKDKQFIGYDVNAAENGVWLPSPYALSMHNEWPSEGGLDALRVRPGDPATIARQVADTEDFKYAFTVAAIEKPATTRQFHMRHADYSNKVRQVLGNIGARLHVMTTKTCPLAKDSKDADGKFNAPYALKGRLNLLSSNLRRLVTGDIWRPPLYTDALTEKYSHEKKHAQTTASGDIEKVL
jgi:hypothetical protein